jgi:hypothetical protein
LVRTHLRHGPCHGSRTAHRGPGLAWFAFPTTGHCSRR